MSQEMKERHCRMVNEIRGYLSPDLPAKWRRFMNNLSVHLEPTEIASCEDVFDVFKELKRKGIIKHGEYQKFRKVVDGVDQEVVDIIDRYTEQESADGAAGTNRRHRSQSTEEESSSSSATGRPPSSRSPKAKNRKRKATESEGDGNDEDGVGLGGEQQINNQGNFNFNISGGTNNFGNVGSNKISYNSGKR